MESCDRKRSTIVPEHLKGLGILPAMFFGILATALCGRPLDNLVVQKICSPGGQPASLNEYICNDTHLLSEVAEVVTMGSTIHTITNAVSTVLFGFWRDTTGRNKPLLILGQTVHLVIAFLFLYGAWDWTFPPWVSTLLAASVGGLLGDPAMSMGSHCYLIENSKPEERTMRLQFFIATALLAHLIAGSISGFVLTALGYLYTFSVAVFLHICSLVLIIKFIKEKEGLAKKANKWNVTSKLKSIFKSRPNNLVFWMMLFCGTFIGTLFLAEGSLNTYYLQQAFHLTIKESSLYGTFHFLVPVLGSITMPTVFSKILKWSDFTAGIVSASLTTASSILTAFASTRMFLCIIAPLNFLKFIMNSVPASIFTRCINNDELGLYIGFMTIVGLTLPIEINYLYKYTFSKTLQTMPGAYHLITAAGCFIILVCFSVSYCMYKEPENTQTEHKHETVNKNVDIIDMKMTTVDEIHK